MTQDNKPFQWDEQKIRDFAEYYRKTQGSVPPELWGKDLLEEFKASSMASKAEVDWEIQCLVVDTKNFWLQKNGLYRNEAFGSEHSAERIMKWADFKHIHSVKRLSDENVFTVGERVRLAGSEYTIKSFTINSQNIIDVNAGMSFPLFFENIQKIPLFTTEDGKEIFEEDDYWFVETLGHRSYEPIAAKVPPKADPASYNKSMKKFSTEALAREYVTMNKPCLSASEVIKIWAGDNYLPAAVKQLASSKIEGGK